MRYVSILILSILTLLECAKSVRSVSQSCTVLWYNKYVIAANIYAALSLAPNRVIYLTVFYNIVDARLRATAKRDVVE